MLRVEATALEGVCLLHLPNSTDVRGNFVKIVHVPDFEMLGLQSDFQEQFFSTSRKNVLRGMHCQMPPHEHAKLVACVSGEILDVVVNLRRGTPDYGRHMALKLHAGEARALYIPPGFAHGFLTLSDEAVTYYNVTSVHHPQSDTGLHWRSFGFDWPVEAPIISERDMNLPSLAQFSSPF